MKTLDEDPNMKTERALAPTGETTAPFDDVARMLSVSTLEQTRPESCD